MRRGNLPPHDRIPAFRDHLLYLPGVKVLGERAGDLPDMVMRSPSPHAKKIARERIAILFSRAREFFHEDPSISHRCVEMARRISMRQRVRIDRSFRRQFCRHCYRFLVPGENLRVRIHHGRVVMTCRECGRQMRIPLEERHEGKKD